MATSISRQSFLRSSALGLGAAFVASSFPNSSAAASTGSPLGLTHGDSRPENVLNALKLIETEIRAGLQGKKRVLIKPNMVTVDRALCATHADCIEGILEFLKPLTDAEIVIAETVGSGTSAMGYDNYKYTPLEKAYKVKFIDLDEEDLRIGHLINEKHEPVAIRLSTLLNDPDTYQISATRFKTHDRAVVTLGLKNFAVGAILKDPGYTWGWGGGSKKSDKAVVHGGPQDEGMHYNLFYLAEAGYKPHLSVLDGFEGMEGNGPIDGTPVEHHVAVASTDWLAADVTGATLMGFDPSKIDYLAWATKAKLGMGDISALDVRGEKIADHVRKYKANVRMVGF